MAEQTLSIRIIAKNLAKGVLDGLDKTLGRGAASASKVQSGLGGSVLKANLLSAAISGGVSVALGAAGTAAGFLSSKFSEAADAQTSLLAATASFGAVAGRSFEDSQRFLTEFETELAKTVSALPGATSGYIELSRAIADEVVPAFIGLDGVLNEQGLQNSLSSISSNAGLLGSAAGVRGTDSALAIQRAIGGGSISELRQLAFFERNPALLKTMEKALADAGVKSFKELDPSSVVKIVDESLSKFATPELKERAATSINGLIENLQSTLFDPTSGIFGLNRDIDANQEGVQSVLGRFNKTLSILIGENGILAKIGTSLSGLIGGEDPLVIVDRGLKSFNHFLTKINGLMNRFQSVGDFSIGASIESLFGDFSPSAFINRMLTSARSALSNIDGQELGKAWGESVSQLVFSTARFIRNIDWGSVLGIIQELSTGFRDFILSYFKEMAETLLEATIQASINLMNSLKDSILGLFEALSERLKNTIGVSGGELLQVVAGGLTGGVPGVVAGVARAGANRLARYSGIQQGDAGLMGGILMELANKPRRSDLVVANTSEAIMRPDQIMNVVQNSYNAGANTAPAERSPIALTVNIGNVHGGQEVVSEVMRALDSALSDRLAGTLA